MYRIDFIFPKSSLNFGDNICIFAIKVKWRIENCEKQQNKHIHQFDHLGDYFFIFLSRTVHIKISMITLFSSQILNPLIPLQTQHNQKQMKNWEFDLTNQQHLLSFDSHEFFQFCSKNGKKSNFRLIINEKLQSIIKTANSIKNSDNYNMQDILNHAKKNRNFPKWGFCQYKFFAYVVYFYCFRKKVYLKNLTLQDFSHISQYFPQKPLKFLFYQYLNLLSIKKDKWTFYQDQVLVKVIKKFYTQEKDSKIQWKRVAFYMFDSSEMKISKNYKECRERWANHLNPAVNRNEWSIAEDKMLFKLIEEYGKKWSKLVKKFNSTRTEHMIKNRYNSYIRKWTKVTPHKGQDFYLKEIISYLMAKDQKCQKLKQVSNLRSYIDCQQKSSKYFKKVFNKRNLLSDEHPSVFKQNYHQSQSQQIQILVQQNKKEVQFLQRQILKEEKIYQKKDQFFNYLDKDTYKPALDRQEVFLQQIKQYIPEYISQGCLKNRYELFEDVQIYCQKYLAYSKVLSQTWLTQLQERQNLKWLENFYQ